MAQDQSLIPSGFVRVTRYEAPQGPRWLVSAYEYRYIAKTRSEAIIARRALDKSLTYEHQIRKALNMPQKPIPLAATLSTSALDRLGVQIYIVPGVIGPNIYFSYLCIERGPFTTQGAALEAFVKMIQNDLSDMTEAYHGATEEPDSDHDDYYGILCPACDGSGDCYCGSRDAEIPDYKCYDCGGQGGCRSCYGSGIKED